MFNRSNLDASDQENSDIESTASSVSLSEPTSRPTTAESWHDVNSDCALKSPVPQIKRLDPIQDDASIASRSNTQSTFQRPYRDVDDDNESDEERSNQGRDNFPSKSPAPSKSEPWVNPYWGPNWKPADQTLDSYAANQSQSPAFSSERLPPGSAPGSHERNRRISDTLSNYLDTPRLQRSDSSTDLSIRSRTASNVTDSHAIHAIAPRTSSLINSSFPGKTMSTLSSDQSQSMMEEGGSSRLTGNTGSVNNSIDHAHASLQPDLKLIGQPSISMTTVSSTWENPYWKNQGLGNSASLITSGGGTNLTSAPSTTQHEQSWENPYWKTPATQPSSSIAPRASSPNTSNASATDKNQAWENPYWKSQSTQSATQKTAPTQTQPSPPAPTSNSSKWENPYWKSQSTQNAAQATAPTQTHPPPAPTSNNSKWENPYWKNQSTQSTSQGTAPAQTQPSSSATASNNSKWENPYWKGKSSLTDKQENTPRSSQSQTTPTKQDKPWTNPYSKTTKTDASFSSNNPTGSQNPPATQQQRQPWTNPYWGNGGVKQNEASSQPQKQQQQQAPSAWVNPYWTDKNATQKQAATSSPPTQTNTTWVNPYWKDWKPQSTHQGQGSFEPNPTSSNNFSRGGAPNSTPAARNHLIDANQNSASESIPLPVPPFFERVYPSPTSSSIAQGSAATKPNPSNTKLTSQPAITNNGGSGGLQQISENEEPLPFTIDSRGVAHFQKDSFLSPGPPQGPTGVTPPAPASASAPVPASAPYSTLNMASAPAAPTASSFPPKLALPMDFIHNLLTSPKSIVITQQELDEIHDVLHKLEQNPNAIPVIPTSQTAPTTNQNSSYLPLNNFFTNHTQPTPNRTTSNPPTIAHHLVTNNPLNSSTTTDTLPHLIRQQPLVRI